MDPTFEKRRERHAIGEFSAAIHFFQGLSADAFSSAVNELRAFAQDHNLPAPVSGKTFSFKVESGNATPMPVTTTAGWQRYAPDGEPELTVLCEPDAITYTSRSYTTWDDMLPKIMSFFEQIAPFYLQSVPGVTSVQVRYLNEFRCLGQAHSSARELFRRDCAWLPARFSEFEDSWHSHSGAFENVSEETRRLININVDCRSATIGEDPTPVTIITALLIVAQKFDLPGQAPLIVPESELSKSLCEQFSAVHDREKQLLAELLSDKYLVEVGAKGTDHDQG